MDMIEVEVTTTACAPLRHRLMHWSREALIREARAREVVGGVSRMHKHELARLVSDILCGRKEEEKKTEW